MKAVLIGNGPSNRYYDPNMEGIKCGFNLTKLNVDVIFVSDAKVINKLNGNPKVEILKKPFLQRAGRVNIGWNTGQNAYKHLRSLGYTEFDLFGFDLMWSNTWASETDKVFNKDAWVKDAEEVNMNDKWNSFWDELIDTTTRVHAPKGSKLSFENEYAEIVGH